LQLDKIQRCVCFASLSVTKWKEEHARLIADKQSLNRDYYALKNEVSEAEKIRRGVYDIVSAERRREQPQRAKDMER